jgi:hypothetical protein
MNCRHTQVGSWYLECAQTCPRPAVDACLLVFEQPCEQGRQSAKLILGHRHRAKAHTRRACQPGVPDAHISPVTTARRRRAEMLANRAHQTSMCGMTAQVNTWHCGHAHGHLDPAPHECRWRRPLPAGQLTDTHVAQSTRSAREHMTSAKTRAHGRRCALLHLRAHRRPGAL